MTHFDLSSLTSQPARAESIGPSADLDRILALPARVDPTPQDVETLSHALRKNPRVSLRPLQAASLIELVDYGGLVAPIEVGGGKTLITFTAPVVCEAQRPVLILPSGMFRATRKTQEEFAEYHPNWHVRMPHLVSYTELGRATNEHKLLELRPDLLMLDEADVAGNTGAAVTRRINRCVEWLRPRVAVLSGTLITDHLMDYYHLIMWALGPRAPLPLRSDDAHRWARAIDADVCGEQRVDLGSLSTIPGGVHEWMRTRRGIVPTPGDAPSLEIQIRRWCPEMPESLRAVIDYTQRTGTRPDGELLGELEQPRCLSALACGFFPIWDPMPPDWWLQPRRAWHAYKRAVLDEQIPGYDSESQIVAGLGREMRPAVVGEWVEVLTDDQRQELRRGLAPPPAAAEGAALLDAWHAVEDQFTPNPVPVWITDSVLRSAIDRAGPRGCLIWSKFRAVGAKLAELGVPHYGDGVNPQNHPDPGQTISVSIAAHHKGRNLQAWSRELVLTPMAGPRQWEQLIGRVARYGQTASTIFVDTLASIDYHHEVLSRVRTRARATGKSSGFKQRLSAAKWM